VDALAGAYAHGEQGEGGKDGELHLEVGRGVGSGIQENEISGWSVGRADGLARHLYRNLTHAV
jgi:hypothetical protein